MKVCEICVGPLIPGALNVSEGVTVTPLGALGAAHRMNAVASLLNEATQALLQEHIKNLQDQAELAEPACLIEADIEGIEIVSGRWEETARKIFSRTRYALLLTFGEGFSPFCEIAFSDNAIGLNLIFPRARGLTFETPDGPTAEATSRRAYEGLAPNSRFSFLLSLYDAASRQDDPRMRAAHLFVCLEALAAGRFIRREGQGVRDDIRMMLRYGYGSAFPLFQIGDREPIEVDHIGVVGRVRDSLFHGLGEARRNGLEEAFELFDERPDIFAFALTCDCLFQLLPGKDPRPPEPLQPPERGTGGEINFRFHVVTEERLFGHTVGALICPGEQRGELYIGPIFRDFTGGGLGPFRIEVPGGAAPLNPADKFGYKLRVAAPQAG